MENEIDRLDDHRCTEIKEMADTEYVRNYRFFQVSLSFIKLPLNIQSASQKLFSNMTMQLLKYLLLCC